MCLYNWHNDLAAFNYYYNRFMALCLGLPGWAGTKRNFHPLTSIMIINHPLSASSIYYDPYHPPCSIYAPDKSFCTTSLQVLFGLPLSLTPSTSYSIHFFTQSLSSFHSKCPYQCNLFCCSTMITSSNPSLSFNSLLGISFTLMPHILISVCWSATSFSFSYRPGLTSNTRTSDIAYLWCLWLIIIQKLVSLLCKKVHKGTRRMQNNYRFDMIDHAKILDTTTYDNVSVSAYKSTLSLPNQHIL